MKMPLVINKTKKSHRPLFFFFFLAKTLFNNKELSYVNVVFHFIFKNMDDFLLGHLANDFPYVRNQKIL